MLRMSGRRRPSAAAGRALIAALALAAMLIVAALATGFAPLAPGPLALLTAATVAALALLNLRWAGAFAFAPSSTLRRGARHLPPRHGGAGDARLERGTALARQRTGPARRHRVVARAAQLLLSRDRLAARLAPPLSPHPARSPATVGSGSISPRRITVTLEPTHLCKCRARRPSGRAARHTAARAHFTAAG